MTKYVIAVRRGLRDQAGREWSRPLATIEDLEIVGAANPYRVRVEATDAAIEVARRKLSSYCHIEAVQPRYTKSCPAVERIPGKVSGAWVFKGTRVPVRALFENLEDGASLDDFLEWFPGVTRAQAEAVLSQSNSS